MQRTYHQKNSKCLRIITVSALKSATHSRKSAVRLASPGNVSDKSRRTPLKKLKPLNVANERRNKQNLPGGRNRAHGGVHRGGQLRRGGDSIFEASRQGS